jgi:hypothetical protein
VVIAALMTVAIALVGFAWVKIRRRRKAGLAGH